jgi:hypothetical protein
VRLLHWVTGGILTIVTLLAVRRGRGDAAGQVLFLGALVLIMILISPVCHLHYFCLSVPLVMSLLAAAWDAKDTLAVTWGLSLLFICIVNVIANSLPHIDACQRLRDTGLAAYAALLCWLAAVVVLRQLAPARAVAQRRSNSPRAA